MASGHNLIVGRSLGRSRGRERCDHLLLAPLAGVLLLCSAPAPAAEPSLRKIGEMELSLRGLSASVEPESPVVPKNVASAVRVVVRAGAQELSISEAAQFLGAGFEVHAELSGPGLIRTLSLPDREPGEPLPADPFLLEFPPLPTAGNYTLANLRILAGGRTVLDVTPSRVTLKVIERVLVTSVKTRPLSLDEIVARGIDLADAENYLGFGFTLGLKLESEAVQIKFPVVFNREGEVIPDTLRPPPAPPRLSGPVQLTRMPTIVPMLLEADGDDVENPDLELRLPGGEPVRIPGLLVIPGDVGYLKQFFSAQLFVANGAPVGSGLVVTNVEGTIGLPLGADGVPGEPPGGGESDDPLSLPDLIRDGEKMPQPATLPVVGLGPDELAGTADDVDAFNPGEQGLADFTIRGDAEGFHPIAFDIRADLDGLPVGRVALKGRAEGGVLVRNPYFDMSFVAPSVVRTDELFTLFVTVTNVGQGAANLLNLTIDEAALSGAELVSPAEQAIPELVPGNAKTFEYQFRSLRTGEVVASYLRFDAGADVTSGSLKFTLGVGERGVALSPDTLVLPASVDAVPPPVVRAAMRVLGQAWSVANAPSLPRGVEPIDRSVVQKKALALAEAGLRTTLGQDPLDAVRDLAWDFYAGDPTPDPGFDQLLRTTEAGRGLVLALGAEVGPHALGHGEGPQGYERDWARLLASGPDFLSFTVTSGGGAATADVALLDDAGHRTEAVVPPPAIPRAEVPGAVLIPLGGPEPAPLLGLLTAPVGSRYEIELVAREAGPIEVAVTVPRGDGTVFRGTADAAFDAGERGRVVLDLARPTSIALEHDGDGGGVFLSSEPLAEDTSIRDPEGPQLLSAQVIGPEVLAGASPFGVYLAVLFDRVVDDVTAADPTRYTIPSNEVRAAQSQLSGRLVFVSMAQPEGPYVPTSLTVEGMADARGAVRPGEDTVGVGSLLVEPGAVVSGRVITAEGEPVTGGAITYVNTTGSLASCLGAIGIGLSRQDLEDGRYELRYVRQSPCGPFEIVTQDPTTGAKREVSGRVRTAGERIVLDIALLARGSVTGTVTRFAGPGSLDTVPAGGVSVVAFSLADPQSAGSAVTDGDGHYAIGDITVGPVNVRAGGTSGVGQGTGRIDRPGTPAVVDILLDSDAARIHGTVRAHQGGQLRLVPDIQVLYYLGGSLLGAQRTDVNGEFAFESVPVGQFRLEAALNTRDKVRTPLINAGPGDDVEVPLIIEVPDPEDLGTVRGRVVLPFSPPDPPTPVEGAVVSVGTIGTVSAGDGTFEITDVPVTPFALERVNAYTPDGLRTGTRQFTFSDAPNQIVNVGDVVLSDIGDVWFYVEDHEGNRLGGQLVLLQGSCRNPCGCASATTGPSGQPAIFRDLPVGRYTAKAFSTGGVVQDVALGSATIPPSGGHGEGTLVFPGAGTVVVEAFEPPLVPGGPPNPVHGAEVALRSQVYINDGLIDCGLFPGESHRGRTDQDGRIVFTNVNAGRVSVTAHHPFFDQTAGRSGTLAGGAEVSFRLDFTDTIAGELSGTVYLPDGDTSAGAGVEVTVNGPLPDVTVKTNDEGRYRFAEILPAGSWTFTAVDPQTRGLVQSKVVLQAGQDAVHDVRLKGRGTVRVRVVDGADNPVSVASVTLRETEYPDTLYEGVLSDSTEGIVTFRNVYEGPLSVEASDPFGRGGRASGVLPRPGDTVEVTVRLTTTGTVSGIFRLPPDGAVPGDPIPFGTVKLLSSGRVVGQTTTGSGADAGQFSFDYVPAGPVRLEALDPLTGRTGFSVGEIVSEGQDLVLDVVAQALGSVHGTVTANTTPEPLAEVKIVSGTYKATAFADADGMYRVDGVPAGRVTVTAQRSGGFLKGTNEGTLTEEGQDLTVNVALRDTGRVEGVVLEAGRAAAAPLSVVTIDVGGTGGGRQTTTTDEQTGAFAFDEVPSGAAVITVDVVGSIDQARTTVQVPALGVLDNVVVELNGVGSIDGLTTDVPPGYTQTVRLTGTGPFPWNLTLIPDAAGAFQVPEVLAGPFTARLEAVNLPLRLYGTLEDEVRPGEETSIVLELQPTGRIQGTVFRSDGAPAYGAEVRVKTVRGTVVTQVDADGSFGIDGIPADAVTVEVSDSFSGGVGAASGVVPEDDTLLLPRIDLDDSPVSVTSVSPPDGATGIALTQEVTLTFTDPVASAIQATVFVTDGVQTLSLSPVVAPDGLSLTLSPKFGGWPDSRELRVTVTTGITDVFGRHPLDVFTSRFETVDLSPPQVVTVVPAEAAIQVPQDVQPTVTFDEPLASTLDPVGLVTLTRFGGGDVPGTVVLSPDRTVATFQRGELLALNARYVVTVNGAVDESGNTQTLPFVSSFTTLDTIPPLLVPAAPAPGAWTSTATPTIQVDLSDPEPGSGIETASASMTLDGAGVAPSVSPTRLTFTPPAPLAEGLHTVEASVADRAGNVGVLPGGLAFNVDVTPPSAAAITSPLDAQTVRDTVSLTAVATDTPSGVAEIRVFLDGASVPFATLVSPFAASWDTTSVAEGPHSLTARAVDLAGHLGPSGSSVSVLVDNDPLVVDILAPGAGESFGDALVVRVQTSEPADRVDFTVDTIDVPGTLVAPRTYEATLDVSGLAHGPAEVTATAYGLLGEVAAASVGVQIDHEAPPRPNELEIVAEATDAGFAFVRGGPGAVEGGTTVVVTNPANSVELSTGAALDGSFGVRIAALLDDVLTIVAVDSVGNASEAASVVVVRSVSEDGVPLDGLSLWVSVDQGVTTAPGGGVERWADRTDNANDLLQLTEDLRPTFVPAALNEHGAWDVIRFDGVDDVVQFTTRLLTVRTVFWVVSESPDAGSRAASLLGDSVYAHFRGGLGDPGSVWDSTADIVVKQGQTWLNGQLVNGTTTPRPRTLSVISLTTTGNTIASRFGMARYTSPWAGDLVELLVYDRVLTPGERQSVEDYLVRTYQPYTPKAGTPAIAPAGGAFTGSTTVQLTTTTPGAEIRYTLDGSEPTDLTGEVYTAPFVIAETTTVKARAFRTGYDDSDTATATFTRVEDSPVLAASGLRLWLRADAGIATNAGGWVTQWADQSGTGNDAFQTNGTATPELVPNALNGLPVLRFDGDDTLDFTTRLLTVRTVFWVVAESDTAGPGARSLLGDPIYADFRGGDGDPGSLWTNGTSASVIGGQTWVDGHPVDGLVEPRPRTLSVVSVVTTGNDVASRFGAARYTDAWDGDLAELIIYDRPLTASERKAVEDYLLAKYAISAAVTTPTISPPGGVFDGSVTVSLSTWTPGAAIHYTLDGSEPTESSTVYMGPFDLTVTTTLKAKAFRGDLAESATATAGFTRAEDAVPASTPGLQLWWRADAGVPAESGDWWEDQSGMGNHGMQANGAKVARLVQNEVNGLPVMRFDGGDTVDFTTRLLTVRTVFWVVAESDTAGPGARSLLGDAIYAHFRGGDGDPGSLWTNGASASVIGGQTWVDGRPVDGRTELRPRTLSVVSLVATGNNIASRFGAARYTEPWHGDLAELIMYDRPLAASERKAVEDYLLAKYGVSGAVTTPTISPAGGVFDGSVAVSLSTRTPDAEIHYTLDGSEPTSGSPTYAAPLTLTTTTTLKTRAYRADRAPSAMATAGFTEVADAVPAGVAGLQLWWSADAGVPAEAGDHWGDQSGNGNHGSQPSGAEVARLVQDVANGLPVMRFDGTDSIDFTTQLSSVRTVFWVVSESPAAGPGARSLLGHPIYADFRGGDGDPGPIWSSFASINVKAGETWVNGLPLDGTLTPRPRSIAIISLVTAGNTIASKFGEARYTARWNGDLAELIIYDRALTPAERLAVEDYLNAKYGIFIR